jgi:hypothetical protein
MPQTGESVNRKFSLNTECCDYFRYFDQQIDDYAAGKFPERDTFVLGKTPDIFQKVGLSALPMTMDQIHVDYALNGTKDADHLMGADLLKKLRLFWKSLWLSLNLLPIRITALWPL